MFSNKRNIFMLIFMVLIMIVIFFMLKYSFAKQDSIEKASITEEEVELLVSEGVKDRASDYREGEKVTEGHIILGTEEKDKILKIYTVSSVGIFGFENGVFTTVSGSGEIPTVLTFQNNNNKWELKEYKEPLDGGGYSESIKKMFPPEIYKEILNKGGSYIEELQRQQADQASEYLKSINREAEVNPRYVEKELVNIDVDASNYLFSELTKYDEFLNNFPYWIGTVESIEEGTRYIYETIQDKTKEGHDLLIFKKTDIKGKIIQEAKYKIQGSEVIKISD